MEPKLKDEYLNLDVFRKKMQNIYWSQKDSVSYFPTTTTLETIQLRFETVLLTLYFLLDSWGSRSDQRGLWLRRVLHPDLAVLKHLNYPLCVSKDTVICHPSRDFTVSWDGCPGSHNLCNAKIERVRAAHLSHPGAAPATATTSLSLNHKRVHLQIHKMINLNENKWNHQITGRTF